MRVLFSNPTNCNNLNTQKNSQIYTNSIQYIVKLSKYTSPLTSSYDWNLSVLVEFCSEQTCSEFHRFDPQTFPQVSVYPPLKPEPILSAILSILLSLCSCAVATTPRLRLCYSLFLWTCRNADYTQPNGPLGALTLQFSAFVRKLIHYLTKLYIS